MTDTASDPIAPAISLIVPTFREAGSLPHLIDRIDAARREASLPIELIIVDDDSRDGTVELVESLGKPWVRLIVRQGERGLSSAVIRGLRAAAGQTLVVMDADLSHPPESIPALVAELDRGADFVIGSRYAPGGTTDEGWSLFRRLNSRIATLMARPLTRARDPMSGFFALRRAAFERAAASLNPIGYKIGLELIVKCGCRDIREVPIHFADRRHGQSKLSLKEQLRYVQHLRRLFMHRHPNWSSMSQFAIVGLSGTVVNLTILTLLHRVLGVVVPIAAATAIIVSMMSNFIFNRRFTFSYARQGSVWRQFIGFVSSCGVGVAVQYVVTLRVHQLLIGRDLAGALAPQAAAMAGIAAGMAFNYVMNRYLVFRRMKPAASGAAAAP